MTKEELSEWIGEIERKAWAAKRNAIAEYCFSNNGYNIGDIFCDHIGCVLIKEIAIHYEGLNSCCKYRGVELKKDGTAKKNNAERWAYQCNDIKSAKKN